MLGTLLGNYRVVEQLAEGSMGVVYLGRHETLSRRVVVKVLLPELSRNADMVERFFHEAQAATAIRNPGIVQVIDFGTAPDGSAYFVMELLEGESLAVRLRKRRLDATECCRIGRQVANVLAAAHAAGITHRDLKPENLFLISDPEVIGGERIKVLDFGVAKLASEANASGIRTRTGLMIGSPTYMSPEQCRSFRTADARSDIYSLGCILFEIACGRPPFVGVGMGDLVGAHLHAPPPDPQHLAPSLPSALSALIAQMLSKPPDSRPQSMAEVSQALDEILRTLGPPPRAGTAPPARASTAPPVRASSAPPVRAPSAPPDRAPEPTLDDPTLLPMNSSLPRVTPTTLPVARPPTPLPVPSPAPAGTAAASAPAPIPTPAPVPPSAPAPVPYAPAPIPSPVPRLSPTAQTIAAPATAADAQLRAAARRRGLVIGGLFVGVIIAAIVISIVTGGSEPPRRQIRYETIEPSVPPDAAPFGDAAVTPPPSADGTGAYLRRIRSSAPRQEPETSPNRLEQV